MRCKSRQTLISLSSSIGESFGARTGGDSLAGLAGTTGRFFARLGVVFTSVVALAAFFAWFDMRSSSLLMPTAKHFWKRYEHRANEKENSADVSYTVLASIARHFVDLAVLILVALVGHVFLHASSKETLAKRSNRSYARVNRVLCNLKRNKRLWQCRETRACRLPSQLDTP